MSARTVSPRAAGLLALLSGASALVYEVLWVREVSLVVGVHAYALGTVLASFFAGMAAGASVVGRRTDAARAPLRVYGLLEIGIALSAALVSWLLARPVTLHAMLATVVAPRSAVFPALRFAVCAALLLPPTFLMGGTLPVLSRVVTARGEPLGRAVGRLYALNTLGAVLGVLASALVLVRALGVGRTLAIAVAMNAAVGLAALALRGAGAGARAAAASPLAPRARTVALALYAASGFTSLAYEVVWTRVLVQVLYSHLVALAAVLAVFLGGIVVGSWAVSARVDRLGSPWRAYAMVQLALAAATLVAFLLLGPITGWWIGTAQPALVARYVAGELVWLVHVVVVPGVVLGLPAFLVGVGFPIVVRLLGRHATIAGDVGRLYLWNTLGGVAGSIVASFAMIPALGTQRSLLVLAAVNVVAGLVAAAHGVRPLGPLVVAGAAVAAGVAAVAVAVPADFVARTWWRLMDGRVVYHREGVEGTVAVYESTTLGRRWRRLVINGASNTGDIMASRRYMRLQAHLPVLLHEPEPRDALVVCFGTGITYGGLFQYPSLTRRVCVELSSAVVGAADLFAASNAGVPRRPGSEVVLADGRNFLLSNAGAFDVITLEPPPPNDAGTVNLYTREFYRLCKARLRPDGVMAQWLPLYLYDDDLRMLVRAFLAEFPHVTLWSTERQETLLVGTTNPLAIDVARLSARMAEPAVAADLDAIGVRSPAELLSLYLMDEDGLRAFVGDGPALTDDFPRAEYSIPADLFRDYPRTLAYLLQHRAPIAPHLRNVDDPEALAAAITRHAAVLDDFYRSALAFQAGDRKKSAELGMSVYARDPLNAYFLSYLPAEQEAQLRARAVSAPAR